MSIVIYALNGVALPASGGAGGGVTSVNGHTGVVVLAAADVGADVSGAAATAQTNAQTYTNGYAVPLTAYAALADVGSLGTNVVQGTPHTQYRNEAGSVTRLVGQLTFSGSATGTLFILPAGSRPPAIVGFQLRSVGTGAASITLTIDTSGVCSTGASLPSTVTLNFDGVTFIHA